MSIGPAPSPCPYCGREEMNFGVSAQQVAAVAGEEQGRRPSPGDASTSPPPALIREETIEECARVAESTMVTPWFDITAAASVAIRYQQHIAKRIRALSSPLPVGE